MVAAAILTCSSAGLLSPAPVSAATSATPYPYVAVGPPQPPTSHWAERLAAATLPGAPVGSGDFDNDGVGDVFVGQPALEAVYLYSGRTRRQIPVGPNGYFRSPQFQSGAHFGFFVAVLGDVNGDRKADVAIGTDAQDVSTNRDQGRAWVFSGANAALLSTLDSPVPQAFSRFGSRLGRAGDVNGDGAPDVIAGASNANVPPGCTSGVAGCRVAQGQAFVFSSTNGAVLRTLDLPVADEVPATCGLGCGSFGLAVQGPGDVSGDGVPDQLVSASSLQVGGNRGQGRMYLFSGANGALLARIDDPVPQAGATFGFQDAAPLSPGDVNNDGIPDLYGNGFQQNGSTPGLESTGRAWVFDGRATVAAGSGRVLYEAVNPNRKFGGQFGWSMSTTNYNRDTRPDLYIGSAPHHQPGTTDSSGGTYVIDGRNGAALKRLELSGADAQQGSGGAFGSELGWALAAPGDLNGDCHPDYLAGAPFQDVGTTQDHGMMFAFQSQVPAPSRCPLADFDGNGNTDVAFFRRATGQWFVRGNANFPITFGMQSGDVPVPGDYNGDGVTDPAIFRAGIWFIHNQSTVTFGTSPGDIPVPGDYNGDRRTDIAIFRPSTGQWFVRGVGGFPVTFGSSPGDVPVPGDYNGDGRTDVAVFRPSNGTWYIRNQSSVTYGTTPGDVPVPGDYNGDGFTDVAVFRPSSGTWFIRNQTSATFGSSPGDVPVPGDYNGDSAVDLAIFRPATGQWFVRNVVDFPVTYGGTGNDMPVQLPYAIRRVYFPAL